ncbi:MAG: EAL domain-containing protein [Campylobacterota bacterium]|nr:EAL domain-containing protein [Campylobacterota bacterium]
MKSYNNIKPLSLSVFFIFIFGLYYFINIFTINTFNKNFETNMHNTQKLVEQSVESFILIKQQYYQNKAKVIFSKDSVLNAIENKDRDKFYLLVNKYYSNLKMADNNLWGLHIVLPNNLSFIRVHKPHVSDKMIQKCKKPLIDKVNKTHKVSNGFETGKFGYFFRINVPIFSKTNKYLGVAEFSVNLDDFTQMLKQKHKYDCSFLVKNPDNKEFLNNLKYTVDNFSILKPTSKMYEDILTKNLNNDLIYHIAHKYKKMIIMNLNSNSKISLFFDITGLMNEKIKFEKDSMNFFNSVFIISLLIWLVITVFTIKLLRIKDKITKDLENINKELDKKVKDKTKEISSLLKVFDKNVIASKTDVNGIIMYISDGYVKISGYSKDELLGNSHNIARHPNMPSEIYEDLWHNLKNKKTWNGELKNLKKDGGIYWTKATIEPYFEDNILIGYSAISEDISSKKELELLNYTLEEKVKDRTKSIENQLYFDSLTGLKSYQALNRDVEKSDFMFTTLMLVNIDNFQNINGLYGFEVGNSILKEFAQCLNKFNEDNTYGLYRIYADEFVLFENCEFTCVDDYYEDLLLLKEVIDKHQFHIESIDESIQLDATVGISLGQENPITTVDMALRYAKKHKLWFQAYNSTLDLKDKLEDTIIWKEKIKSALKEDRIIPVFQPIVNREQDIIKYEVLLRMQENNDDKENLISPHMFLEESINAKQYNNIAKVIFEKTFMMMQTNDKMFSINISYDDIYNNTLIQFIEENIKKIPNIANRLVIEILETTEIGDDTIMKTFIDKFKSYGVGIAIDDFGTGHSNLTHILNINPDYIKIDGAFIKNINEDKQSYAMVKSVVLFCKELDIKVIAEYVHSKEVFDTLYKLGVDEYQGFYFSEPKVEI